MTSFISTPVSVIPGTSFSTFSFFCPILKALHIAKQDKTTINVFKIYFSNKNKSPFISTNREIERIKSERKQRHA